MDAFLDTTLAWLRTTPRARDKPLDSGTDLIGSGLLDSLAILEVVSFVESRFGVQLPVEAFTPENFRDAAAIADLARRLGGRA
jgi:acyl carrier protein